MTLSGIVTKTTSIPTPTPSPTILIASQHLTPLQKQGLMVLVLLTIAGIVYMVYQYHLWRKEEERFHS